MELNSKSFNSSIINLDARYFVLLENMFGARMVHDTSVHQIFRALAVPGCKYIYGYKSLFNVFLQTNIKYFNILLTQESSDEAIDISKLRNGQRSTGKFKCDRHLSVFDKRSEVANCINRTFAYKSN